MLWQRLCWLCGALLSNSASTSAATAVFCPSCNTQAIISGLTAFCLPVHAFLPAPPCRYAFSVWFPLQVSLQKELGELLVGLGLVGSALQLFEGLELWDNLIVCYQLLDKRVQVNGC